LFVVSWVYFGVYSEQMKRQAEKSQQTAFSLIFDSVQDTIADSTPDINAFIQGPLAANLNLINEDQDRYDFNKIDEQRLYRELPGIYTRYRNLVSTVNEFALANEINKFVVYDKDHIARVIYLQESENTVLGIYLGTGLNARFIPYTTQQLSDLGSQLIQFLSHEELWSMLKPRLPDGLNDDGGHELPSQTTVQMGSSGDTTAIQYLIPIKQDNSVEALSEIDIGIKPSDVARFANYSHTDINIFTGDRLCVGTLPKYALFDLNDLPIISQFDFADFHLPEIFYSTVFIAGKAFSQARMAVGSEDDFLVLTANFPLDIMSKERESLLITIGITILVIGLLSFLASGFISARVNIFVQQLLNYLRQLAQGGVPEKMAGPFKGEVGAIKNNFNALITNYGETVEVARKISEGDLEVKIQERSSQDQLSRSLNIMTTNLKRAQETLEQRVIERTAQLAESDERYQLAEKAAHIGSWDWNISTGALHWSEKIYTLFGLNSDSFHVTYAAFIAAIHPDDRQFVIDAINLTVEQGREYWVEHRVVWPNGQVVWVSEKGAVFYDEDDQPCRMLGVIQDITQRKQTEMDLQQAHDELEEKVMTRTADLEAANLRLQELDKLKSMFIASMSHELRTPLNSIIGFSGLLLQGLSGDLNDEQKGSLERVYRSGNHLLGLISDVIDISKIEAGRIDFHYESFPLEDVVVESIETIRPQADAKGLELTIDAELWPQVYTDRKRLLQCLLNYLSNAVKFSEQGKVTLSVTEANNRLSIEVRDTGIGIAEEDMSKLFEAFERLETHLRIKAGGTGLGLYLTKKITEDILQGSVTVVSQLDKGSTFGLIIPINVEDAVQEDEHDNE